MGIFDRLAQGPGNAQPQDYQDWNQMVGAAPPSSSAARPTVRSGRWIRRTTTSTAEPGVGGTDPFGALQPQQRSGLAGHCWGISSTAASISSRSCRGPGFAHSTRTGCPRRIWPRCPSGPSRTTLRPSAGPPRSISSSRTYSIACWAIRR